MGRKQTIPTWWLINVPTYHFSLYVFYFIFLKNLLGIPKYLPKFILMYNIYNNEFFWAQTLLTSFFFNFFWENKSRIEMTNFLLLKVQEFFLNWFHFHTFPASRAFDWKLGLKRVVHCTPVLLWMVLKLDHFFFF